jgi:hypothetical protein
MFTSGLTVSDPTSILLITSALSSIIQRPDEISRNMAVLKLNQIEFVYNNLSLYN